MPRIQRRPEETKARRTLGAGVFNERYDSIPDHAMPAVAPEQEVIREEINLGQAGQGKSVHAEGPTLYEQTGVERNAEYISKYNALDAIRDQKEPLDETNFIELVTHMPPGFRISNEAFDLSGYSIGEIVHEIRMKLGEAALRGLYLDADVVNLNLVGKSTGILDEEGRMIISFNQSITDYHTTRLPLWKVSPMLPRNEEFPEGFQGGSLEERKEGLENTIALMRGDAILAEQLGIDLDDETALDLQAGQEEQGSDVSSYYIVANSRLVRRVRAPAYIDQRASSIRTGGFSELLTETTHLTITLEEVVEAYIEKEGYTTPGVQLSEAPTPELLNDFRRVIGHIFTLDVFTGEDNTITLIVPGGSQETSDTSRGGGCCVDTACYWYLMKEYEDDEEKVKNSMREIRNRFETLYLAWRAEKRDSRKKRKRSNLVEEEGETTTTLLTSDERKEMLKDLAKTTRYGYSSQTFKFYQTAVHCVTGYLPCIYYHRYEKARDYNQGIRVRMVQVGAGAVSKQIKKTAAEAGDESPGYLPINILRINIDGVIHVHKPKSLCLEETSEFISDDDSTGLLHAITMHPGLSDAMFTGVNAKKREVLLGVIEKKTKAIMNYYRSAAVGLVEVTKEMMLEAVSEQLRRQDSGVTSTLIYGVSKKEKLSQEESEGGNVDEAEEGAQCKPKGPALYYSNAYDREGRKIPERPLIVAYDLETVELTAEAVRAGGVGEEFLKSNPNPDAYLECERQIPFCVSWVPVNVSDEGQHRNEKERLLSEGSACSEIRDEEVWSGFWNKTNEYVFCSDGRRVRMGYVMLSEVKVCYGGNVLGRCINEFISDMTEWAMDRGYTSIHAYAHNGVGFDSYVVQAFNTKYEYHNILKTGRGLLAMRLKIPFITQTSQRRIFPVTFLDTKVFLSFSLSKLCEDFKVPECWSKLDFPITKINWRNCYHPEVLRVLEPYSINDARALAYIIKQINRIVCLESDVVHIPGSDELPIEVYSEIQRRRRDRQMIGATARNSILSSIHPPVYTNPRPPIAQFITIMSCVKRVASMYINEARKRDPSNQITRLPAACDLPVVRHWIEMASMGGRVSAYAKMFSSSRWREILQLYMTEDKKGVASLIKEAIKDKDTSIVLDVTSLYPSAMAYCSMPMGSLRFLNVEGCVEAINSIKCELCETLMQLCPKHRETIRPFAVIVIRGGLRRTDCWEEMNKDFPARHLIGRKLKGRRERGGCTSTKLPGTDVGGLVYTNEEDIEMTYRLWGFHPKGEMGTNETVLGDNQAYTNIDLYWAAKSGFDFEIVGGYEWETSYELHPLISSLFNMRVEAKEEGNTCLQQAIKLLLNSLFGVHSQRVIRTVDKVISLPENIRESDVNEEEFARYIRSNHQKIFDPRMRLQENIPLMNGQSMIRASIPGDIGEAIGGYSPNHVGCAVLAWSRHIMSLTMFNIPTGHLTYTDTDSIAVSESWYDTMIAAGELGTSLYKLPPLISLKGSELMTYKNDHSDFFPNARVLFSAIGAKKVKMHVIGCPDTGEIKICSTFKGFLRKDTLDNGDKLHAHQHEYTMAKTLLDILYSGKPGAYTGTKWGRALGCDAGVTISRSVVVDGDSYTYLGKKSSFALAKLDSSASSVGVCVPFGTPEISLYSCKGLDKETIVFERPNRYLTKSSPLDFIAPHLYTYFMGESWEEKLEKYTGVSKTDMYTFIGKVFDKRDDLYKPKEAIPMSLSEEKEEEEEGEENADLLVSLAQEEEFHLIPEEREVTWGDITDIFDSVAQEDDLFFGM